MKSSPNSVHGKRNYCAIGNSKTVGAEEGTRTPTPLRVHGPEPCASANSATTALCNVLPLRPDTTVVSLQSFKPSVGCQLKPAFAYTETAPARPKASFPKYMTEPKQQ